jgi:hypothetical protein
MIDSDPAGPRRGRGRFPAVDAFVTIARRAGRSLWGAGGPSFGIREASILAVVTVGLAALLVWG